jgi:hypothetical protein
MAFRKIEAGLVHAPVDEFIGKTGTIFYDNDLGDFRISDGQTPGGIALSFGGGGGGNYSLPTATTTVKGGVKIDGTTIAITNQVIRVGTVPYSSLSGTPTIPTNNNQLTNGAAYITSSALTGLATESYVTNQGYITSSALTGLASETYVTTRGYITSAALSTYALTSSIPTDINQLADASGLLGQGGGGGGTTYITNNVENPFSFSIAGDDSTLREIANGESIKITGAGGITVTTDAEGNVTVTGTPVSLAGLATETYVTSRGYITGLSFNDLTDKPNLAGTYSWSIAGDDSTLREISAGESVKFVGASGITTASDAEGNITITGPSLAGLATETFVTTQGYITSSALTGLATETYVTTRGYITSSALTGLASETFVTTQGYITSSALTGLATENYVTSRGYITGLSYNDLTDKPNLAGTYTFNVAADDSTLREISTDETVKFVGASGITTASDAEGNITITGPSLAGLATETFVTTQGYITSSALTGLASESYVTSRGYITGLSYNDLTDKPNLAGTYSWSIAADDSTLREILANETVKFIGAGSITTASDAEGNITITGAAQDRLTSNARSAVLNSNGTFSLPTLTAEPATPQAGQMALANGTSWDPIAQNNGAPYMVIYTGSAWIGMGGVTVDKVYEMILEMG